MPGHDTLAIGEIGRITSDVTLALEFDDYSHHTLYSWNPSIE